MPRITPAYAGKRGRSDSRPPPSGDHPRVCGEKALLSFHRVSGVGSPPRMRGKVSFPASNVVRIGITPAYAGKSESIDVQAEIERDHPRVCGEKKSHRASQESASGSPPRMRGKASELPVYGTTEGITPAYAGKSEAKEFACKDGRDHPRVCGEKGHLVSDGKIHVGSPPRMRGKEFRVKRCFSHDGITPAYAGKRLKRSHRIGHFSCILCLFHSVLHRASASGGSRAGPCAPPCLPAQNAVPV